MKPMNLKAVLFDLDGTLVDTAAEFVVVVQQLRAEHGLDTMDPERIRASVSNGARALVNLSLGIDFDAPEFESKRLRLLELYAEVLGTAAAPYPGIRDLLDAFAERGIRWGVATNKPRAYAEPLLPRIGLDCPSLVCPDDVQDRKPHPESLYLNCRELDCAPHEAIYVGDHLRDIEAGKRAGMYTIAAAYGYIEPGDNAADWGADVVAARSEDLYSLILND
ncbi:phosphoglycolate phosphatase [Halioglobus japonicus]|uniref:HAD family hydrolase n=2 Tax=Halioglobus japonicus TaxID=930805 RepID=UPI0009794EA4|nr:HAD-IA family hydrolase [Halioglobus japonicus]AQA19449.1 phosphoglycolate phosphatase [Halioglobus japonicus]GHD08163.1 phosphoglycolate phosphatase 2 [Halioglobus japonicus]